MNFCHVKLIVFFALTMLALAQPVRAEVEVIVPLASEEDANSSQPDVSDMEEGAREAEQPPLQNAQPEVIIQAPAKSIMAEDEKAETGTIPAKSAAPLGAPAIMPSEAAVSSVPAVQPIQPQQLPVTQNVSVSAPNLAPTTQELSLSEPKPPVPDILAGPVSSKPLAALDPEAVGTLSDPNGGLGVDLWRHTPRSLVEAYLKQLVLPIEYPVLNQLARRLLLTAAAVPPGASVGLAHALTRYRLELLLALGAGDEAWQLSTLIKFSDLDEPTQLKIFQHALLGRSAQNACAKLPIYLQTHTSVEWQKIAILCQLQAGETTKAQSSFDVLRDQKPDDPIFMALLENNLFGSKKTLPRRLTPLQPLTVLLLLQTGLSLPNEVYVHPPSDLISSLLQTKVTAPEQKLILAEKAAVAGIISSPELAAVYASIAFNGPDFSILSDAAAPSSEVDKTGKMRALIYQALEQEKLTPEARINLIGKFLQISRTSVLNGSVISLLAKAVDKIVPAAEYAHFSGLAVRIYTLAARPDMAKKWLVIAKAAGANLPDVRAVLQQSWPLIALSGVDSEQDFQASLDLWLNGFLQKNSLMKEGAETVTDHTSGVHQNQQLQKAGLILGLLEAAGIKIEPRNWAKVIGPEAESRRLKPPSASILQRLQTARAEKNTGEVVLAALSLMSGSPEDIPSFLPLEITAAFSAVGLTAEAKAFAVQTAAAVLAEKED